MEKTEKGEISSFHQAIGPILAGYLVTKLKKKTLFKLHNYSGAMFR
jgi:hypothetical protein